MADQYESPKLTADQLRGIELMRQGANLYFANDAAKELFKHLANIDTVIGSYVDSGGCVHVEMAPICDYDMISIANVLRSGDLAKKHSMNAPTEKQDYYKEKWNSI